MARLIYSAITSLDGFVNDVDGRFDWAAPDEQVHGFVNELERTVGTYLYGRRMFETMVYWATAPTGSDESAVTRDYAEIWQAADKLVFSSTLGPVNTPRTQVRPAFDAEAVRAMIATSARDVSIGGPTLAACAIGADLVDECHLFVVPVAVGGGTKWWPGGVKRRLQLLGHDRFDGGAVHLHYRISR